jgi:hypothetical protein
MTISIATSGLPAAHTIGLRHAVTCPRCNGFVRRIRRRPIDRLVSVFVPMHRYRCCELGCGWEGNRSIAGHLGSGQGNQTDPPSGRRDFAVDCLK